MRWPWFIALVFVVTVLQCTLGSLVSVNWQAVGLVGPDFLAAVAVFIALRTRTAVDAMLAAWALGMALDATTALAAGGATAIGPMSIAYALAAGGVFRIREAFYSDRLLPQAMLTMLFCGVAHAIWLTLQSLLGDGNVSGSLYGRMLLQAAALAVYTGIVSPVVSLLLGKTKRLFITAPAGGRSHRAASS